MIFAFTLHLKHPDVKWSGEEHLRAVTRTVLDRQKASELTKTGEWTYDFGDGWIATITSNEVSMQGAKDILHRTKGFSSYDWMIDSILTHGDIYTDKDLETKL